MQGSADCDTGAIDGATMKDDPVVTEVRKQREKYARKFAYDLLAICEDLRRNTEKARNAGRRVVSPPPRNRPSKKAG
jgi:hypothetical protein